MTIKKWIPLLALVLFVKKAIAVTLVGLAMAITVLIIGGVIIYKFIQFFHSPAWTNPGNGDTTTNTVSSVYFYYDNQTTPYGPEGIIGEISPTSQLTTNYQYGNYAAGSPIFTNGFQVTYGLDLSSNPVVTLDNSPVDVQTGVANGSNYTMSIAVNIAGYSDVISFSSSNMMNLADQNEFDLYVTNGGPGATTNSFGDVASDTGGMLSTNLVILQRSCDLLNWTNILTNMVSPGVLQTYSDPDIYPAAFYRLAYPPRFRTITITNIY